MIETTNRVYGCLEKGGTIGRKVLYTFDTLKRLGIVGADLINMSPGDPWNADCTVEQYLDRMVEPDKIIRKGHVIN